jgi:hypothetical protein
MKSSRPFCMVIAVLMSGAAPAPGDVVSDFSLEDVNSTSVRHRVTSTSLSPRDYIHQVAAWYFGNEA